MRNLFYYRLKYKGLNFSNFLNFLIKYNIKITNVDKVNNKEIDFNISCKDYKKYKKLKPIYNVSIVKRGGLQSFFGLILKRSGIIAGVIIISILSVFASRKTLFVDVRGTSFYQEEIKQNVIDFGIKFGQINNFNNDELEKYILENNSKISLVSVKKQGTAIIVNVVEKNENELENYESFYSPYNMVIKEIKLISGTLNVGKESVVKKGNILVEPYTISSNGERIGVPAKAEIVADVWFCGSESANKEIVSYEKTNNKKVYKNISFLKIKNNDIVSPYNSFMSESLVYNIANNYFMPIYLTKTIFYETAKKIEKFNFENEKNNYLEKSKQKAYDILPKNVIINETIQNITELNDKYIFQTYLKATMEISNED